MAGPAGGSPFGSNELQAVYDEVVGACEAIAPGPEASEPIDGFDTTRTVKVVLDGSGRVQSLTVNGGWRSRLDTDALGPAIIEAVQDAAARRLRTWGESVAGGPARRTPQFTSQLPKAPAAPGDPTSDQARQALAEVFDLIHGLSNALGDLERMVREQATRQVVGRAPDGTASVTLRGGAPVSVDLDLRWLARTDATTVAQRVKRAFDAAYEAHGRPTVEEFAGDGPLGRILALGSDPRSLIRRLGLAE